MTNEEKINEIGNSKPINWISDEDLCTYQQGLRRGAFEMAEWKEEQMIDWFRKNINKPFTEGGYITYKPIKGLHEDVEVYCAFERLVEDFKKAMKE